MHQVSQLFGPAYAKAASVSVVINGFKKAGVFPRNPNVYEEAAFCLAEVAKQPDSSVGDNSVLSTNTDQENDFTLSCENNTEIALHAVSAQDAPSENDDDQAEASGTSASATSNDFSLAVADIPTPASIDVMSALSTSTDDNPGSSGGYISVEEISPHPKRSLQAGSKRRHAFRSTILTSSPHKHAIMAGAKRSVLRQANSSTGKK